MGNKWRKILLRLGAVSWVALQAMAGSADPASNCTIQLEITGSIGPATLDYFDRGLTLAKAEACSSLLLLINTPGGSLQTTRMITEAIVNAPIPVLCLVHPSGGHAGSAGAIILQACHVSGAMRTTNIGAATPISSGGEDIPKDLRTKLLNDTRSWVEGMARLRGRSEQFAKDIILKAKSVTADEAKKINGIDHVTESIDDFLIFAENRTVTLKESTPTKVQVGELRPLQRDLRFRILSWFTDPEVAYLILMGSLALLYFEITHPGVIAPGVIGGIGLVFALVSMHKLDVSWAGLLLIFLGVAFMVAEIFVTSFGILGIAGALSFIGGSLLLYDPATTGIQLSIWFILPPVILFSAFSFGVGLLAVRTLKLKRKGDYKSLEGQWAEVTEVSSNGRAGMAFLNGETWSFEAASSVQIGQKVKVLGHRGLVLKISNEEKKEN